MAETEESLEPLLNYLKEVRSFDFTGYKRSTLTRRIRRRMQVVGAEDYTAYTNMLEANPGEFAQLFDTILINVTSFRRDPEAWDFLAGEVIPQLVAERSPSDQIRVWSAGAASGQEAYTLAVLLADALGDERFRSQVKIYATDVDESALVEARRARYPAADVTSAFGEEQARRYFEFENSTCTFRKDLRRVLIFGRHDLVQDPPISRIDLLTCRNTLMYFTSEIQRRILANFAFALGDGGVLFLGKSEMMLGRNPAFDTVDLKQRVFRRTAEGPPPPLPLAEPDATGIGEAPGSWDGLLDPAFELSPVAQMIVAADGKVHGLNRHARAIFELGADVVGRPLSDLTISRWPIDLRSRVDEALGTERAVAVRDIEWEAPSGHRDMLDVVLTPVEHRGSRAVVVTYIQAGRFRALRDELERSQGELQRAYGELQSTVEELETTNEELQSTNEELETTNEELHSANEELETMNEEMQSTNEELETANSDLRDQGIALDELNRFLESVLGSLRSGVAVLGTDLTVRAWNRRAEDMWGLRADEVEGTHFLNLDIGLPVDKLTPAIRSVLSGSSGGEELVVDARTRRGEEVSCRVRVAPMRDDGNVAGVILMMDG